MQTVTIYRLRNILETPGVRSEFHPPAKLGTGSQVSHVHSVLPRSETDAALMLFSKYTSSPTADALRVLAMVRSPFTSTSPDTVPPVRGRCGPPHARSGKPVI